ncbi:MAG TPA: organomercurial lyase [Streptosporangiaceae bacterium]|nr:organomercurial lyase [Streptosporangiaceae bacterium]
MGILTAATVMPVSGDTTGRSAVIKTAGERERELAYGQILVAAGRRPASAGLNLDEVGVKTGRHDEVVTDEHQRTANPRIWAAGDVAGGPQFVYAAAAQGSAAAANALFSAERNVHYTALPRVTFTSPAIASAGLGPGAIGELEATDTIHVANGIVAVASPFSGTPTPHRVELDGTPAVYAMCAIDALGLPAMTGRDARITSADPLDGQPIQVTVRDGSWTWTPAGAVAIIASATDCGTECGSWESMCPNTTFHASRDTAQAYLAGRGNLDAQILGQDTAIERGRLNFGSLLGAQSDWRPDHHA